MMPAVLYGRYLAQLVVPNHIRLVVVCGFERNASSTMIGRDPLIAVDSRARFLASPANAIPEWLHRVKYNV